MRRAWRATRAGVRTRGVIAGLEKSVLRVAARISKELNLSFARQEGKGKSSLQVVRRRSGESAATPSKLSPLFDRRRRCFRRLDGKGMLSQNGESPAIWTLFSL